MWPLETIIAMNEAAHQRYLRSEGITEEEFQRRSRSTYGQPSQTHQEEEEQRPKVQMVG